MAQRLIRSLLAVVTLGLPACQAFAQPSPGQVPVVIVASCGTATLARGALTVTADGELCTTSATSGTVTANQGTPAAIGNAWPVYPADSTGPLGAVADAAWSGTGNSTAIAALKAIYNNLASTVLGSGGQATAIRTVPANDQSTPALAGQYPFGATAITASATGTTAATVATLAAAVSKTTYICGFTITSDATVGIAGAATVSGTITGSLNYIQGVGAIPAVSSINQNYAPCIPASATNTGIAVTSAAAGTGGNTAVATWGFQL